MRGKKIAKFVISGGFAAGTEFLVFFLLHSFSDWLIFNHVLSFLCGLGVSFTLNKNWVFSRRGRGGKQFTAYTALALFNIVVGSGLIVFLTEELGLEAVSSKVCVMLLIATWNFMLYERVIFRKRHSDEGSATD